MPARTQEPKTTPPTKSPVNVDAASSPDPRQIMVQSLKDLLGLPYLWGKKSPEAGGMDCSGAANYARYKAGLAPKSDGLKYNANDLYERLPAVRAKDTQVGDLVFYGTSKRVTHVMVLIGDGKCIGEAGGGPRTTTLEAAKKAGACMKVLAVDYRRDIVGYGKVI